MGIITFSKEFASGGREVGENVAKKLFFSYFDREIVKQVALKSKVPEIAVQEYDQDMYNPMRVFFSRVMDPVLSSSRYKSLAIPAGSESAKKKNRKRFKPYECEVDGWLDSDIFKEMIESFILEIADKEDAVIVGRGAQCILKGVAGVFHVRIVSPVDYRVERAVREKRIMPGDAKKTILDIDRRRRAYIKNNYDYDWEDPLLYHLIINTGCIDLQSATDIIVDAYGKYSSMRN